MDRDAAVISKPWPSTTRSDVTSTGSSPRSMLPPSATFVDASFTALRSSDASFTTVATSCVGIGVGRCVGDGAGRGEGCDAAFVRGVGAGMGLAEGSPGSGVGSGVGSGAGSESAEESTNT